MNNIRIAIQKNGRLKSPSINFLQLSGLNFGQNKDRQMISICAKSGASIASVRHSDIPFFVENGSADFGIVGKNVLLENSYNVNIVGNLGFGQCRLIIAVPINSRATTLTDINGQRIATSYPNSLRKFLSFKGLIADIIEVAGAVEITPALGVADAICDITQTGTSLKENDLRIIAELYSSEAVLIENTDSKLEKKQFFNHYFSRYENLLPKKTLKK